MTFTCTSTATGSTRGGAGEAAPGCYQVSAQVTDATTGTSSTFTAGQCAGHTVDSITASLNCTPYASPLIACPAGATTGNGTCTVAVGGTFNGGTVFGINPVAGQTAASCGYGLATTQMGTPVLGTGNQANTVVACTFGLNGASVTINPGAPHVYLINFTFYTLLPAGSTPGPGACPGGTYIPGPAVIQASTGAPPLTANVPVPEGVCRYMVQAQKKYVEVTNVTLTPVSGCTNASVFYSEGLKAFFSPPCIVSATATGTVVLKTGVNCATELATLPATAPAEFGAGATYSCTGGVLSVIGVPSSLFAPQGGLPISLTGSGLAPSTGAVTFGGMCAGGSGTVPVIFTNFPGSAAGANQIALCATGVGTASVFGTYLGPINTQPSVQSNTITFTLSLPNAQRIVPTVRWAGEKAVLTKCFGGGGTFGGASVEFTLQGSTIANASLIPTTDPNSAGSNVNFATANTVWTVADASGCASVIVYARSEGIVNVDAAIFGTVAGTNGAPLLNEHAFTVYYLKFDHVDLENVVMKSYAGSTLAASLTWDTPGAPGAVFGTIASSPATYSLPNPPGTGFVAGAAPVSIPLCQTDYVRAMVHGYFEIPGDPSGRPAANVTINGAPTGAPAGGFGAVGSYVLPAGRWVLPDDWPVLATFAGYNGTSPIQNGDPASVFSWDLNSGFVFNPGGERAVWGEGPSTPPAGATTGALPLVATGPFYSEDAAKTPYSTAPLGACAGGLTIGIGPFDSTQACTNPFPLTYSPAGSLRLTCLTGPPAAGACGAAPVGAPVGVGNIAFFNTPTGPNSTYLPNGTLNQWDAPMPPAQVSFGVTSGPGYLQEANKAGLYNIAFTSKSTPSSAGVCPAGTTGNATPATSCLIRLYPNPFYAEAIPASPLIPPITNNGGYLWNSWGFTSGTTLGLTTGGAFVAGESTTAAAFAANTCPAGFVPNALNGLCMLVNPLPPGTVGVVTLTAAQCQALGGTFTTDVLTGGLFGACTVAAQAVSAPPTGAGTIAGGTNLTAVGTTCPAGFEGSSPNSVVVANGAGFTPGQTVEAYSTANGQVIVTALTIAANGVTPVAGGMTVNGVNYANAATLTFTANVAGCIPAATAVFAGEQIGVPIPGGANLTAGQAVGLFHNGAGASTNVFSANGTTTIVVNGVTYTLLGGAEAVVRALGGCIMSRGPVGGPVAFGTCEPATVVPAGTLVTTGAVTAAGGAPITGAPVAAGGNTGPYPFWQWVPNPASAGAHSPTGTVYSDNHGEAMVALQTGVSTTTAPVAGVCPTNFVGDAVPATICFLKYETLGGANPAGSAFQNIAAALAAFPAGTSGCLDTTAAGTATQSTNNAIGENGPAAGQICINTLGRIEFGALAALGTTTVQAVADYPYTRGDHPPISSAVLTKVWTSQFNKSVTVSAAIAGPAGTQSYVVTITATDICGNPIVGEPVFVYAVGNAGAVVLAPIGGGTALGTSNAVVTTNANGIATLSLEVLTSALGNNGLVIKAVFPGEGIERFATVIAPKPANQTVQVIYTPGYNMVGGPSGSNFSSAEAVFSYDNATNAYVNQTASEANLSSAPPACTGYFAYFASATTVNLPATSKPGDTATCNLAAGWNLIGNPFASAAALPSGTTAYHFNGSTYDVVGSIPVGGAVYIYNSGAATTITLTAT